MYDPQTTQELARMLWRRVPGVFALAVALGFLGIDALLSDLGLWTRGDPAFRYIGALAAAVASYGVAAAWRSDARERARREIDRTEA